jgi:hypothetical protein
MIMIEHSQEQVNIDFWEDYILFVKRVLDRIKKEKTEDSKRIDKEVIRPLHNV